MADNAQAMPGGAPNDYDSVPVQIMTPRGLRTIKETRTYARLNKKTGRLTSKNREVFFPLDCKCWVEKVDQLGGCCEACNSVCCTRCIRNCARCDRRLCRDHAKRASENNMRKYCFRHVIWPWLKGLFGHEILEPHPSIVEPTLVPPRSPPPSIGKPSSRR